jgi:hypothetical protein
MKTLARFAIGISSSLLAAAGMMQTAQRLDPLSRVLENEIHFNSSERPAEACAVPCSYAARPVT